MGRAGESNSSSTSRRTRAHEFCAAPRPRALTHSPRPEPCRALRREYRARAAVLAVDRAGRQPNPLLLSHDTTPFLSNARPPTTPNRSRAPRSLRSARAASAASCSRPSCSRASETSTRCVLQDARSDAGDGAHATRHARSVARALTPLSPPRSKQNKPKTDRPRHHRDVQPQPPVPLPPRPRLPAKSRGRRRRRPRLCAPLFVALLHPRRARQRQGAALRRRLFPRLRRRAQRP